MFVGEAMTGVAGKEATRPDWLQRNTGVERYVADLKRRHAKYAGTAEQARRTVDEAAGNRRLTEILYKSRAQDDVI